MENEQEITTSWVANLFETRDYEMFKLCPGNRNINPVKVKDLLRSFNERHYPVPIIVDEQMQVLDGQHRLQAAKIGGFPVIFLKLSGDIEAAQVIRQLNDNQKPYSLPDHLKLYVHDKRGDYVQFQNLYEHYDKMLAETGITRKAGDGYRVVFTSMLGLLCGRDNIEGEAFLRHSSYPWKQGHTRINGLTQVFRNGEMKLNASKGIITLDYLIKLLSILPRRRANGRLHRNAYLHLRTREYLCSIHYLLHYRNKHTEMENEIFDPQIFLTQAESFPQALEHLSGDLKIRWQYPKDWTDALKHIEEVYNHKRGKRKRTYLSSK